MSKHTQSFRSNHTEASLRERTERLMTLIEKTVELQERQRVFEGMYGVRRPTKPEPTSAEQMQSLFSRLATRHHEQMALAKNS